MARILSPLLSEDALRCMREALANAEPAWQGSLDLGRSVERIALDEQGFVWREQRYPWPTRLRPRAIHYWDGSAFVPAQRFGGSLIKLVPTAWQAPTFEIDGIKMLPSAQVSPWDDAQRKVALIEPAGKRILDTCGGLGYYAACCLAGGAARIDSFEKNPDVLWLRQLNPWSPDAEDPQLAGRLQLRRADSAHHVESLDSAAYDAALHDPPRFGIAGELYSLAFYQQLARVLRPGGRLFHYTGTPNARSHGRDLPGEVMRRLQQAGFETRRELDGVFATRRSPQPGRGPRQRRHPAGA